MSKVSSLKSNFAYNLCYHIFVTLLPLVTAPYISRVLGPHQGGIYSVSHARAEYFLLFAMLGVNNYGNRSIARVRDDRYKTSQTFWEIYFFQLFMSICVVTLYLGYCLFVAKENRFIYLVQILYVASGIFDINWFCFGMEKFKLTTIRSTVVRCIVAASILLFVKKEEDLWIYALIMSLGFLFTALAVWPFVAKHIDWVKPSLDGIVRHIKPNLILFFPIVAISIYNIMDKLMLEHFSTKEEVAFYSYAENIVKIPLTFVLALDNVVMPRMSNLYANDKQGQAEKLMNQMMVFTTFVCVAMSFGMAGVGGNFAPWFYGKAFVRCGWFMMLLSPTIMIKGWAGNIRTQLIIPTGKDKLYLASLVTGAFVNVVLNLLLIPRYNGVGAILGTLAAEFAVCFVQFFALRKQIPLGRYMMDAIAFCVIGLVMFLPVYHLRNIGGGLITILVQILTGGIVYCILGGGYLMAFHKDLIAFLKGWKKKA